MAFDKDAFITALDSMSVMELNDLVKAMAEAGYGVTVYPLNGCAFDPAAIYADMPDCAEVMYDRSSADLGRFMTLRHGYYDAVWIARTHNLAVVRPVIEQVERELLRNLHAEPVCQAVEVLLATFAGSSVFVAAALLLFTNRCWLPS